MLYLFLDFLDYLIIEKSYCLMFQFICNVLKYMVQIDSNIQLYIVMGGYF